MTVLLRSVSGGHTKGSFILAKKVGFAFSFAQWKLVLTITGGPHVRRVGDGRSKWDHVTCD